MSDQSKSERSPLEFLEREVRDAYFRREKRENERDARYAIEVVSRNIAYATGLSKLILDNFVWHIKSEKLMQYNLSDDEYVLCDEFINYDKTKTHDDLLRYINQNKEQMLTILKKVFLYLDSQESS